jgi:ubiquinone/menaquinone biosynthesis C-methylase UbiE
MRVTQSSPPEHAEASPRVVYDAWQHPGMDELGGVERSEVAHEESVAANQRWWDSAAAGYQAEHGEFLGDADFVWGPEGLREADAHLLGPVDGRRVLEIGAGAAQCSRWLAGRGAQVVALDVSAVQLGASRSIDARSGTPPVPLVQADAGRLPFADESVDLACSAYGGVPFVADSAAVMTEVARVLRPGGRWVFSVTHPIRWAMPDDPGPAGLTATASYFDRTPYVERAATGEVSYVEHHRTLGDRVREIAAAGLVLVDLVEPEWPDGNTQIWGGWSPLRGRLIPGTAIFSCTKA